LDEIDKVGFNNMGGDNLKKSLLELLDPVQNKVFRYHFIDVEFDLSKVIFIASANNIEKINPILLDRLKGFKVPNYSPKEMQKIFEKKCNEKIQKLKKGVFEKLKKQYSIDTATMQKWQITLSKDFFLSTLNDFDSNDRWYQKKNCQKNDRSEMCKCNTISIRNLDELANDIILTEERKNNPDISQLLNNNELTRKKVLDILNKKITINEKQLYKNKLHSIYQRNRNLEI
jgi:SpoVK/Ycf46/Vps4 family AAA+-type ATPase